MKIDKVSAVVTGGASGLGAATARALRNRGARVSILDVDAIRGAAFAAEIGAAFFAVDIGDEQQVRLAFQAARAVNGQERVLVHCAGVAKRAKIAERRAGAGVPIAHSLSHLEAMIRVNVIGTFCCITEAARGMMNLDAQGADAARGVMVTTASIAAEDGQSGSAAYAAAKAAVAGMTLPVARDLMDEGIRINAILPGVFETPMFGGMPAEAKAALERMVPFPKRLGNPEEFARAALFIIENDYLNGANIRVDGGMRMSP